MWSESIDACDHAEQGKQQERERKYNDKCTPEPATRSLDLCCSPDTLLKHEPLASSMFSRLFHVCIPLSISSSTDLGADIETCRVAWFPIRRVLPRMEARQIGRQARFQLRRSTALERLR